MKNMYLESKQPTITSGLHLPSFGQAESLEGIQWYKQYVSHRSFEVPITRKVGNNTLHLNITCKFYCFRNLNFSFIYLSGEEDDLGANFFGDVGSKAAVARLMSGN